LPIRTGVQYQFPLQDVQSLAFHDSTDTVTLRDGKNCNGHLTGPDPIVFEDAQSVKYQFPLHDIDAIMLNRTALIAEAVPPSAIVIRNGADLPVRTDDAIDPNNSYEGQTYAAEITEDVQDIGGHVAIPAGSKAKLLVRKISGVKRCIARTSCSTCTPSRWGKRGIVPSLPPSTKQTVSVSERSKVTIVKCC